MTYTPGQEFVYISMLIFSIVFLILAIAFINALTPTKSRRYRKYVTDMFVAGKVRNLAVQDEVDLKKEQLEFLKWLKIKHDNHRRELDNEIEENVSERIQDSIKDKNET